MVNKSGVKIDPGHIRIMLGRKGHIMRFRLRLFQFNLGLAAPVSYLDARITAEKELVRQFPEQAGTALAHLLAELPDDESHGWALADDFPAKEAEYCTKAVKLVEASREVALAEPDTDKLISSLYHFRMMAHRVNHNLRRQDGMRDPEAAIPEPNLATVMDAIAQSYTAIAQTGNYALHQLCWEELHMVLTDLEQTESATTPRSVYQEAKHRIAMELRTIHEAGIAKMKAPANLPG